MPDVRVVAAAALVLAGLSFAAGWMANGWRKDAELAELTAARAQERISQAYAQVKAVDAARLEEQRRTAAQMEIANVATKEAESARGDAVAAGIAAEQLRRRVAELVAASRAAGNPGPAGAGQATDDPIGMLAHVLSRADQRAGILAEYADAARIAGQACERAYDALMPSGQRVDEK
ncbi:DUF2514 family protein [Cupriavidus basilensis]